MTATPTISPVACKGMLNTLAVNFNSNFICIRSGALPSNCAASWTGTDISHACAFGSTAFGSATDGTSNGIMTITANTISTDTSAANSGTAGYFRCTTVAGAGTVCAQGTCGTSSADMILNTVTITAGDTIQITSFLVTMPDGSGND